MRTTTSVSVGRPRLVAIFAAIVLALLSSTGPLRGADEPRTLVHGLWVWRAPSVVGSAAGRHALRDFCRTQDINEVYLSGFDLSNSPAASMLSASIAELHAANVKAELLLSSADADEAGPHRDKLLAKVRAALDFDRAFPHTQLDGLHLDIEPQQRPENKGSGNLGFLPGLVDAYRSVRAIADPAQLAVGADIQRKLLEGDLQQRRLLLAALPQLTLMLYELSIPTDGKSDAQRAQLLKTESEKLLTTAYAGLEGSGFAVMVIGLRTPDYGASLPAMFETLDVANRANPHYRGWARHSYNDSLRGQ